MANAKNVTEATNTTMEPGTEQKTKNEILKVNDEIVNGRKSDIPSREEIEKAVRKIVRKEDLEHHHQKKHVSTVMDIMLQSISSQIVSNCLWKKERFSEFSPILQNNGESGKLDQEIDPTRLGLMLSVVSTFFIVYIFVVLRMGKRNATNYERFDDLVEATASNDGEALEMKRVESRV